MATVVEYVLGLKDNLSSGIDNANKHVQGLEGSIEKTKGLLSSLGGALGTLGVGFAVFKGAEFVHSGIEAFHQIEQETAKIEANLKSTGESAGMSLKDITGMAKKLSSTVQYGRIEILDMESQLLTFPAITKDVFEGSMGMVADIAKQTNHGLSETAIMFGKAFSDPEKGLQKMMRYGVMFDEAEKNKIKNLQASGNLLGAQKEMLDAIAHSGYAGVAKAMFDADPLAQYDKTMGSVKVTVGELAMDLLKYLLPALNEFAGLLKSSADWVKANASMIGSMVKALGAAWLSFKAINLLIIPFVEAISLIGPAAQVATVGVAELGTAATLSSGPVGLFAVAIGAVVLAMNQFTQAEEDQRASSKKLNDVWVTNEEEGLKIISDGYEKKGLTRKEAFRQAIFDETVFLDQKKKLNDSALATANYEDHGLIDKLNQERNSLLKKEETLKIVSGRGLLPLAAKKAENTGTPPKEPKNTATGSKSVTITVAINKLVENIAINTTNLKEGSDKIKEMVVAALVSATNDFQLVAGR